MSTDTLRSRFLACASILTVPGSPPISATSWWTLSSRTTGKPDDSPFPVLAHLTTSHITASHIAATEQECGASRPLMYSKIHLTGPPCWAQLAPDSLAIERALISPYPLTIALTRDAIPLPSCSTGYAR
ncbi:hypothetical protein CSAL01_11235 [Colletotrichum salicis]|uniref:Uncharacterized protein n=1 Tax=Colletotrichum salicis TaxID=1209931 RepID=A0A135UWP9_9PEZI|nr:hypothetical protein CSAL01_11235 [Colletotrichum salicis]